MKTTTIKNPKGKMAPSRRGKFTQQADGRTKEAYKHQPAPAKWKCSICIGALRAKLLLKQEKGRDHASAEEVNEASFASKEALEHHFNRKHPNHVPSGERPTRNRIKRVAAVKAALGVAP